MTERGPDFIGIGAPRCGTTWIYHCLYEHPEICLSAKELNFFSQEENWQKGYRWYESFFKKCSDGKKAGDFSVAYFYGLSAPERIFQKYQRVKLIVCLRDPIDRLVSNYLFNVRIGLEKQTVSLEAAVKQNRNYLEQGRYAASLKRYFNYFPREKILILIYEDIAKNPLQFIQKIYKFIGVNPNFTPTLSLRKKINASRVVKSVKLEQWLAQTAHKMFRAGFIKQWWQIKNSQLINFLLARNTKKTDSWQKIYPRPETNKMLREYYRQDIKELEIIINRQLTEWRR